MNVNTSTARARKTPIGNPPTLGQNDSFMADRTTRSKGMVINKELQQVQNTKGGRSYLEEHQLLVLAGQGLTHHQAATCLFQIVQMLAKMPPTVIQAMRGLAFMLEEIELPMAMQTYHDGFGEELATFMNKIKSLVQHAQDKVDQKLDEINKATANLIKSAAQATMLKGINKESKIGSMGDRKAKNAINKILQTLEPEGAVRICSAIKQQNGSLLIEFDSDFGAAWMQTDNNQRNLCKHIGKDVTTKKRTYKLIAMRVPLSAEPEDAEFLREVEEANRVDEGTIISMRWAKKISH
ncbi:hypothetical protein JR316_0008192 [Psilocybe cubensis]|uniref:Uncharacterized protein n=2 Tax=Psilocybe cubensis TaxID=181762 RepID=A0ACB8GVY8_PSICU|nr:hypothetical protein JR316_0008192 [Psilocybe cubensis]KAH9479597.1 hypothetical protein JR316_0008192 [Psilocybe cubensis]